MHKFCDIIPAMKERAPYWRNIILVGLIIGIGITFSLFPQKHEEKAHLQPVEVIIPKRAPAKAVAERLHSKGIIRSPELFALKMRILGLDKRVKAGRYRFTIPMSEHEVLRVLTEGRAITLRVTIPEGYTVKDIANLLAKELGIDSEKFMEVCKDSDFLVSLGVPARFAEGFLFPDTYEFTWGVDERVIVKQMIRRFFEVFDDSLKKGMQKQGRSLLEIVILASLVEKEAQVDEERPIIAGVYYNRLKKRMPLQCCATIQYILPKRKENLSYDDLRIDSPYNTYKHYGLPPGPICNPGKASLEAACFPASTKYLYFVSRGDGTHIFSRTAKEHIKAKRRAKRLRHLLKSKEHRG